MKLNHDEFDLLRELINVAMGLSASELAKLFNYFVKLTVPTINIESSEELPETIIRNSMFSEEESVIAVRQKFNNMQALKGEGLLILDQKTRGSILPLLGLTSDEVESETISDFLLELSGQLIGSCLSNLLKQFFTSPTSYDPPVMISMEETLRQIAYGSLESGYAQYEDILCSKIDFVIDKVNFQCDLFILFDTESLPMLREALQKKLEESL